MLKVIMVSKKKKQKTNPKTFTNKQSFILTCKPNVFISSTLCYPNKNAPADLNNLISVEFYEAFIVHIKLVVLYRHYTFASALSVWIFIPARDPSKTREKKKSFN